MQDVKEVKSNLLSKEQAAAMKSFLSGGFGGMSLVLVGQPFDLIKVRLQATSLYSGTFDAFKKIIASEGVVGLYRGMSAPLIGITPIFAVCFWGYDMGQRLVRWSKGKAGDSPLSMGDLVIAGGFSAIPATLLMTPLERIKVTIQVQSSAKESRAGIAAVVKQIWKEGGISSLYRGTGATLMRDIPGSMAYFGAYEAVKKMLTSNKESY